MCVKFHEKEIIDKKQIIPLLVDCNGYYSFPIIVRHPDVMIVHPGLEEKNNKPKYL